MLEHRSSHEDMIKVKVKTDVKVDYFSEQRPVRLRGDVADAGILIRVRNMISQRSRKTYCRGRHVIGGLYDVIL